MTYVKLMLKIFTSATILFLIYFPLALILLFSFNDGIYFVLPFKGFTLRWYEKLFQDEMFLQSVVNSVVVAVAVSALSVAVGVPASFAFVRLRHNTLLAGFLLIPFIMPWLVIGVSSLVFFSSIGLPLSLTSVILSHVIYSIPLVVLIVAARLISLNPNYEKASMDLGANEYQTFMNITLPLIYPSIAVSALITFLWSFDNFTVTFFTVGTETTFPIWVWGSLRHPTNVPVITAASSIVIVIGSIIVYLLETFRVRRGIGII
ncbi:MAG: ABC transporter permease [Candidatus Caldarchaeum sp.]|nr:ABC transporter permease [Candidatus Caldarchaeum sp.]